MEQIPEKHGSDLLSMVSAHRRSIMGVAAVLIYIYHKHSQIFPGGFLATLELCGKKILFLGVDIFMLISGLGLTYAIRKHKLFPFWLRRLKRIVLPFLLTGAVVAVIEHWDAATLIGNLSGYNFYAKNIYSFLWFFPAIATLYLLFPLYHKVLRLSKSLIVFTGIVICVWLIISLLFADLTKAIGRRDIYGFTNRIPVFLIGVLLGEIGRTRKIKATVLGWILLVLLAVLGLYLEYLTTFKWMSLLVPSANCGFPALLLAVSLVFLLAGIFDLLNRVRVGRWIRKIFELLGIISLELYAAQRITEIKWAADLPWGSIIILRNLTLFLITLLIAIALYWMNRGFWALVELPFKKKTA